MKILEFQVKLVSELSANPVDRHPALIPDGTRLLALETTEGLDLHNVEILRRIGLGTHSEVYAARNRDPTHPGDTVEFAVKIEKPIKHAFGYLIKEIDVLKNLSGCSATPRYLGTFTVPVGGVDCLGAGLEIYDDSLSSLRETLGKTVGKQRDMVLDWLSMRMFQALFRVNDRGYLHRDVKPSNFMYKLGIDGEPHIALVDFGSSIHVGERNEFPFRGTGAYSGLSMDPMESKVLDDYWAVIFCIIDLSVQGGLPWRSLSARTEEGRAEIVARKLAFIKNLEIGTSSGLTSLGIHLVLSLFRTQDHTSFRQLVDSALAGEEVSRGTLVDFLRPSNYRQIHLSKSLQRTPIPRILLSSKNRKEIGLLSSRCELLDSQYCEESPFFNGVLALCGAVTTHAEQGSHLLVVAGKRICLTDLVGSCRQSKCPLLHLEAKGIQRSAIQRPFKHGGLCMDNLIWKCRDEGCNRVHLTKEDLAWVYLEGEVPVKRARR